MSRAAPFLGLLLFLAALWFLHRTLGGFHLAQIKQALHDLPGSAIAKAILLTGLNYAVLTGYDWLGLKYIGKNIRLSRVSLASFISYAFSNGLGFATVAGSSVRFRLYSTWGLDGVEIAKLVSFCIVTLWLGLFLDAGVSFLSHSHLVSSHGVVSLFAARLVGVSLLCAVAAYLLLCVFHRKSYLFRTWDFSLPSGKLSAGQIVISSGDWALAAGVLYVLLPEGSTVSYFQFFAVFLIAQTVGILSQVPGGLGVLESVVLAFLAPFVPAHRIIASLVVYRAIYYLLPLTVAAGVLGVREVLDRRRRVAWLIGLLGRWLTGVLPWFLVTLTLLAGVALLASGVTPAIPQRLVWLKHFAPLPLLEVSHFLSTLSGAALLILAWALERRINAAYYLTIGLLFAGVLFSLLKGLDYEEALFLSAIAAVLLPTKKYFYRKASIFFEPFSARWLATITAILLGTAWLGFFSYKHTEYSNDVLWRFAFHGDAPRAVRAIAGIAAGVVVFGIARLLRPAKAEPARPDVAGLDKARHIVAGSRRTFAYLALLGDKRLLFSDTDTAFLMYGVEGRSWVALGDPVGPVDEARELVWRFREICDRHAGWPVFYEAGSENIPLYLDLGLTPMKIGEEARVRLAGFDLEGGDRRALRHTLHKVEREGVAFSIVPLPDVHALLPELRMVSDEWLKVKHTREKGFSLGYFSEAYVEQFPIAVARSQGKVIAFANVLTGADKEELSVDLMRYLPGTVKDVMEYLFLKLMLWGCGEEYRWFNLGMVPLAGLEDRSLAPLRNRLGAKIYRHGEHFYNFQGLRQYKERFGPQWEPKYLVSPGGLHLPHILTNIASLVSGGLKGVMTK